MRSKLTMSKTTSFSAVIAVLSSAGLGYGGVPFTTPAQGPGNPVQAVVPSQPTEAGANPVIVNGSVPIHPAARQRTLYKVRERVIRVFNPQVSRYENRTITETVPVQVGAVTPGGGSGGAVPPSAPPIHGGRQFVLTVVNDLGKTVNFELGGLRRELNPGQMLRVMARDGQRYGYSGMARQVAPGQWVGGGTFQGFLKAGRTTLRLGASNRTPSPNSIPGPAPSVPPFSPAPAVPGSGQGFGTPSNIGPAPSVVIPAPPVGTPPGVPETGPVRF